MSEANPNRRRHSKRNHSIRWPRPRRKPTTNKILPRSSSAPILWTGQIISGGVRSEEREEKPPVIIIPTFYSCSDIFAPSPTQPFDSLEDNNNKVVMNFTVEGSVGPVKALVRLGANVEEAISTVLERYKMEGRSPRLDPVDTSSNFQLHHSLFSLQSLNKRDRIGEVGGRSFYLRKNSDLINNSYFVKDKSFKTKGGEALGFLVHNLNTPIINPAQHFISFIVKKYNKIKRRSRRLWMVLTCNDWN